MRNNIVRKEFRKDLGWAFSHPYFEIAICANCKLGALGLAILSLIVKAYTRKVTMDKTNNEDVAVYYSYEDIANRTRHTKMSVVKAIIKLLDNKLIICTNDNIRSGRDKYGYVPNHKKIDKIVQAYLDEFPEDTDV